MNGIKKAALFLSSLDYVEADQLLSRLDSESAKRVRREIMSLRAHNFSAEDSHQIDEEFLLSAGWKPIQNVPEYQFTSPKPASAPMPHTYSPPQRTANQRLASQPSPIQYAPARPLPHRQTGQQPTALHTTEKYSAEAFVTPIRSFDFMQSWSANDVANALVNEHPQAIAVVLAHLPQSKMKSVLSALPANMHREIRCRLDNYEMPDEHVIQEIESALRVRYRNRCRSSRQSATLESFDEIETLSDSELSTLFHSVDLTTVILSLIGADVSLVARVIQRFSPTQEHEIRKRLQRLSRLDEREMEQARRKILEQHNATCRKW